MANRKFLPFSTKLAIPLSLKRQQRRPFNAVRWAYVEGPCGVRLLRGKENLQEETIYSQNISRTDTWENYALGGQLFHISKQISP